MCVPLFNVSPGILIADLIKEPSHLTCAEEEATTVKMSLATAQLTAKKNELADVVYPLADDVFITPGCSGSGGDHLIPSTSPTASPCIIDNSSSSKPVADALFVDRYSFNAEPGISESLPAHSAAGQHARHASCGSHDVFVSVCSHNSRSATLVEPLSSVAHSAVLGRDDQDMPLASNADGASLASEPMEANETLEVCPLQQLQGISRPSSPSESESEPLGGCADALMNPDHCISDLCLEDDDDDVNDDDDDTVFAAPGHQSPAAADSRASHSMAADLFSADHSLASSVAKNTIKSDFDNLLDASELDDLSFSYLHGFQSSVKFPPSTSVYERVQMSRSLTVSSPFRSPPRSPVSDETHFYSCSVPLDSSSPFRSPPKSSVSILQDKQMRSKTVQPTKMLPFESAETFPSSSIECAVAATGVVINAERMIDCTSSPDASSSSVQLPGVPDATADTLPTIHDENLLNGVTKTDKAAIAGSDAVFECRYPSAVSCCEDYKHDLTPESSVAAVCHSHAAKTSVSEVMCNPPESDVQCPRVEVRCQSGNVLNSSPSFDGCSTDRKGRQTSVKLLKCKFESEQDLRSQAESKSSLNFAVASVPNTAEPSTTYELPRDARHSSYAYSEEMEDTSCSGIINSAHSSGVQHSHTEHNSECSSPSSTSKATRLSMRDFKQCRQPSVSARISCFEPVMSVSAAGCQKENKRARLSSFGSALPDNAVTKLSNTSHSTKDCCVGSCEKDDGGWFVESPQHSPARHYQRSSSAGHEDLLALLNIPATSAKHIPRLSERKRMFEMETAKLNSSESTGLVAFGSPAFEGGPQRLSSVDKENSLHGHEVNCQGRVNSRRSLFEGNSACTGKTDSLCSDTSVEVDCHPFKYPVNRVKTRKLPTDYGIIGSIG